MLVVDTTNVNLMPESFDNWRVGVLMMNVGVSKITPENANEVWRRACLCSEPVRLNEIFGLIGATANVRDETADQWHYRIFGVFPKGGVDPKVLAEAMRDAAYDKLYDLCHEDDAHRICDDLYEVMEDFMRGIEDEVGE
jgi:hypothetical protein